VRGTFDWGVLDEKMTNPNTNIERSKWDFGPTSVKLCHNCVGAVVYVETKCVLKVKLLSVPKRTRARYEQGRLSFSPHVEFIPECFGNVTLTGRNFDTVILRLVHNVASSLSRWLFQR
jgi:hypothetical protein